MNIVRYNLNDLPPLTTEQRVALDRLAKLSDDDIDLSDIPEVTDWSGAIRGGFEAKKLSVIKPQETLGDILDD